MGFAGRPLNELSRRWASEDCSRSFARLVPVGPFSASNIVAGVGLARLLLGTVLGMRPGVTSRRSSSIAWPPRTCRSLGPDTFAIVADGRWRAHRARPRSGESWSRTPDASTPAVHGRSDRLRSGTRTDQHNACDGERPRRRRADRTSTARIVDVVLRTGGRRHRAPGSRLQGAHDDFLAELEDSPVSLAARTSCAATGRLRQRGVLAPGVLTTRLDLTVGRYERAQGVDTAEPGCASSPRIWACGRPSDATQVKRLLAVERDTPQPTMLTGDVNEWYLWGRPLRWLHTHFRRHPGRANGSRAAPMLRAGPDVDRSGRMPAAVALARVDARARRLRSHLPRRRHRRLTVCTRPDARP